MEEAGITDSKIRIRMMMSAEQVQIEEEIAQELDMAQKEMDEKIQRIKESATSKRAPVVKEYETNLAALTQDVAERHRSIEENWSTARPLMIEGYEKKRQKMVEEFESQKFAVEEETKLCSKSVLQQYDEDLKLFEAERLKTTREIREQRRLVQAIVDKEIESIELEALSEATKVEKYQQEVVQSFTAKSKKLKEELDQDKAKARKETSDKLLRVSPIICAMAYLFRSFVFRGPYMLLLTQTEPILFVPSI